MKLSKLGKYSIFALITALTTTSSFADSYWNHNGSVVRLIANGNERYFLYEKPTPKVQRLGVGKNTQFFEGYKQGNDFYGTAHAFLKRVVMVVV